MSSNSSLPTFERESIRAFAENLGDKPMEVYRTAEVVGLSPNQSPPNGRTWVLPFREDPPLLPDLPQLVYLRKTVVNPTVAGIGTFILSTAFVNPAVVKVLTESLQAERLTFPPDSHLRWHTSAPSSNNNGSSGKVYGYLSSHIGQGLPLLINPSGLEPHAIDMQVTYLYQENQYVFHLLSKSGAVHETIVDPKTADSRKEPACREIFRGASSVLTILRRGQAVPFYGTANGISVLGNIMYGTAGMDIAFLTADSELARIFMLTRNGRVYGLPVDREFTPKGAPVLITTLETLNPDTQLFSGPAVNKDGKPALLISHWSRGSDPKAWNYHRRIVEIPASLVRG